jgi:hypothetical protein
MKSLHDFRGEVRAAERKWRRALAGGLGIAIAAAASALRQRKSDAARALRLRVRGAVPDGRRQWRREERARQLEDLEDDKFCRRIGDAAHACWREFGKFPVAVALPFDRGHGPRMPYVRVVERREHILPFKADANAAIAATPVHTIRVEMMYHGQGWPQEDKARLAWIQVHDGGKWVDTRDIDRPKAARKAMAP